MKLEDAYPIVVTDKLAECREFYTRRLGFQVGFEASWFVYLHSIGDRPYAIAFMAAGHPSQPPGPETFSGTGMFLTLQVADAAAEFARLSEAGVPIAYPLRDEPWGQRRFGLVDPGGLWVDVVQQIEPQAGVLAAVHALRPVPREGGDERCQRRVSVSSETITAFVHEPAVV